MGKMVFRLVAMSVSASISVDRDMDENGMSGRFGVGVDGDEDGFVAAVGVMTLVLLSHIVLGLVTNFSILSIWTFSNV